MRYDDLMDIEEAIRIEQAQLILRNMPPAVIGGYVVVCLVIAVFWPVVPHATLAAWGAAALLVSGVRLALWRAYRAHPFDSQSAHRWLRQAALGALLNGIVWGAGAFFLAPAEQIVYQLTFVWAAVMMSTSAMFSFSAYYPAFAAFMLPCMVPVGVVLASNNALLHWGIAAGAVLFMLVASRFMWTFNAVFLRSLQLRFENAGLVTELTRKTRAAEEASLAKSRFLAVASHDLRQPMHALNLYLGAISGDELPERARAILANARQCGEAMDKMFRALLDISKLDAGTVRPELRAFGVASVLDRVRVEFEPLALAKGLRFRVRPSAAVVRSDPVLVERILRNLVANAVNHTQRGGVLIGCRRSRGALRIAVHDTGCGVVPDQRDRIFEEFYQVGNPERDPSKGLGLGLAIVRRLATLLAVPVALESVPVQGSTFAFDLPRARQSDADTHHAEPVPLAGEALALNGATILVVDDEAAIRNAMTAALAQWGCTVVTAGSGPEALSRMADALRAPSLIVCDYRLRGEETGLTVVEALRSEFNEDIPALLITGETGPERMREIAASGLQVLHKPLQEARLREALLQALEAPGAARSSHQPEAARGEHGLSPVDHP
jgi:signal transduction histidine kinase/CheY-like chemotaxis protein